MKKILFLLALSLFAFTANAQNMNFGQTVKYINNKIKCCGNNYGRSDNFYTFSVKKNGFITKKADGKSDESQNIFDLTASAEFIYEDSRFKLLEESNGILLFEFLKGKSYGVELLQSKQNTFRIGFLINKIDGDRLYKALLHLRTLCTNKKDPFDK